ncbi:MAG: hypothetical protein N2449_06540 [Bacteroidales bacterium]|nr:hypothetical protein [Bacteroidales bacterium]
MITAVKSKENIPILLKNSPLEKLLLYHNLQQTHHTYNVAELIIATCVDHRISLKIPEKFAYIIRTGGVNLNSCEFYIAFLASVKNIKHVAIIGHNECAMVHLHEKKDIFTQNCNVLGWNHNQAQSFFEQFEHQHEIHNEIHFTLHEAKRLRNIFPQLVIFPFLYNIHDHQLYLINETKSI